MERPPKAYRELRLSCNHSYTHFLLHYFSILCDFTRIFFFCNFSILCDFTIFFLWFHDFFIAQCFSFLSTVPIVLERNINFTFRKFYYVPKWWRTDHSVVAFSDECRSWWTKFRVFSSFFLQFWWIFKVDEQTNGPKLRENEKKRAALIIKLFSIYFSGRISVNWILH